VLAGGTIEVSKQGAKPMTRTLVAYASKHGSTEEVARAIGAHLGDAGHHVDIRDAAIVTDVEPYDAVVLGGSLYMGRWHADARAFLRHWRAAVEERPLAVFALGSRTLDEHDVADSRRQLDNSLDHLHIHPQLVTVFGGVVDPAKLRFPLNRVPPSDARDWTAIAAWAGEVATQCSDSRQTQSV
jgi:menaquinone-dependent protoporphyrinogen oxidase